jgi:hypothetical protein
MVANSGGWLLGKTYVFNGNGFTGCPVNTFVDDTKAPA